MENHKNTTGKTITRKEVEAHAQRFEYKYVDFQDGLEFYGAHSIYNFGWDTTRCTQTRITPDEYWTKNGYTIIE